MVRTRVTAAKTSLKKQDIAARCTSNDRQPGHSRSDSQLFGRNSSPLAFLRATARSSPSLSRAVCSKKAPAFRYLQGTIGNASIARALQAGARDNPAAIQRASLNPLDWATDLLHRVTRDADADETQVQSEASRQSTRLDDQSAAGSRDLRSRSETQGATLQNEATSQGAQINSQSETEGQNLQSAQTTEATQLTSESAAAGETIQQDSAGTSKRLESEAGVLDAQARSTVGDATQMANADAATLRNESNSTEGREQNQWTEMGTQGGIRVKSATAETEALVRGKTALIQEYQSPGAHDPERFQKRWTDLQGQVNAAERGESNLRQTEEGGAAAYAQAGGIWQRLGNLGQTVATRVTNLASRAWSTLQTHWSALQSTAGKALADVRQRASAAVTRVKNLAAAAWSRLQNLAARVWPLLRDAATHAWNGLKARGAAAWTALQATALAAWTALQSLANSIVTSLTSTISTIVSRINGAVGRIVEWLASAVSSLISRVQSATGRALSFLRSRAAAAWGTLQNMGTQAWQGLKAVAEQAWNGLKDLGTRAWTYMKELGTRVWAGLKEFGTRIWNSLQNLAKRAWDMLRGAWDWIKRKAEAAWNWVKRQWEALKRAAAQLWDWIKRKARAALEWLKRKWEWLKATVRRAIAWLKEKWRWLKSIVKITIRIPDITLVKQINFKPWKFVDLDSGRIPFVKGVVDTPVGPVELALFARAQAEATVGGSVCPCTLKNTRITLQPLISRYTGQTEVHIPGRAEEKLVLTGTIGGSGNLGGAVGIAEGGLKATGTALAFGSLVISPRIVYDSGKISFSERFRLEFCLRPTISLDAFARLVATTAAPPGSGGGGGTRPVLPPGTPPFAGSHGGATGGGPLSASGSTSLAKGKKPPEKVLWEGRWHIGSISRQECWNIGAKFTLTFNNGVPELDVDFDAKQVSVAEVVRSILSGLVLSGGGGGPTVDILKDTTASGICKCVGDDNCGGGKRYKVCVKTQKDCKKAQKDVDSFCNNDSRMKERCVRPKCYYRHTDPLCPDECEPGTIEPLGGNGPGPVPQGGGCAPVPPSGSPTVNKPAGGNDCTPDMPTPAWDVVSVDAANWGVCVTSLPLSGTINIKPWPSHPATLVTPNTANPVDGGNINNVAGSRNHWQFAIDDMADYDTAGAGGAGPHWHSTEASEAHEWAHWNSDFKADAVATAAGGAWSKTNSDLNSLREPKSSSPSPAAAKAALKPKVDSRAVTFRSAVLNRWNTLITTTDKPGKGGRGYAAGMGVLNGLIKKVRSYKDKKGW